jgi:replicative DNA helicase
MNDTEKQEARSHLKDYASTYLIKSEKGAYCCPLCGSGTGKHKSGALSIDPKNPEKWKCFNGSCGAGGYIFDLIGIVEGISDTAEQFKRAAELYGISNTNAQGGGKAGTKKQAPPPTPAADLNAQDEQNEPPEGVRLPDKAEINRLIDSVVIGEYSKKTVYNYETYIKVRFENPEDKAKTFRQFTIEGGQLKTSIGDIKRHLYKPENITAARDNAQPLYIVEGEKDVETLEKIGLYATTSGSSNDKAVYTYNSTKELLRGLNVIVLLDNDAPGLKIAQEIERELKGVCNMQFVNLCEPLGKEIKAGGDVTDFLQYHAADFKGMTDSEKKAAAVELLRAEIEKLALNTVQENPPKTGAELLDEFILKVSTSKDFEPIPTGIENIDKAIGGGFIRKSIVMLGAAPGMGKTALAQWIFENMAAAGNDVLYINLEMSRDQLLARSISRLCWRCFEQDVNALDVLRGYSWTEEQRELITAAAQIYKKDTAPHFIYNPEGVSNKKTSIFEAMQAETDRLKAIGKPAPLICIDYLQLIDTEEKDPIEGLKNVIYCFKDFAIKNDTVIFVIMASNRASNKEGIMTLESGRDTSSIEYSGDLIMGLSYTAIEDKRPMPTGATNSKGEDIKKPCDLDTIRELRRRAFDNKTEVPKVCNEISLKVVKNRFGESERRAKLIFDGKHSIFNPVDSNGFEVIEKYPIELTPFADLKANKQQTRKGKART